MNMTNKIKLLIYTTVALISFQGIAMAQSVDRTATKDARKESHQSRFTQNKDARQMKVFSDKVDAFRAAKKNGNKAKMNTLHGQIVALMDAEMKQTKAKILKARTEVRSSSREVRKGKRDRAHEKRTETTRKDVKQHNKSIRDDKRDLKDDERDLAVLQKRYQRQRALWASTRKLSGAKNSKSALIAYNQFLNTLKRDNRFNRKEVREDRREIREDRREMKRKMRN